ncbi:hypothetical protein CRUP_000323 [Coryphaenoides rupestris]|nr:hypothetical protein CRUP_000323 [Coryphaenoides rupestris]
MEVEMVRFLEDSTTTTTTALLLLQNTSSSNTTTATPPTSSTQHHQPLWPADTTNTTTPAVLAMAVLTPLALATAVVNAGVVATICITRKLRLPANYLICSLAFTDFLVAALVMPPAALYVARGEWRLGGVACEAWLSVDMTCCTCSILHLCAIALDRYWAVTQATAQYARRKSARRAALMIAAAWLVSVLIALPPLFWRRRVTAGVTRVTGVDDSGERQCTIEHDHLGYTVYSTLGAFYVPMAVILVLYRRIYRAARTLHQKRGTSSRKLRGTSGPGGQSSVGRSCRWGQSPPPPQPPPPPHRVFCVSDASVDTLGAGVRSASDRELLEGGRSQQGCAWRRERKAAAILGLILGAFVLCWLPFFLKELLVGLRLAGQPSPGVSDLLAWLGYANSLVNPLLYTSFNDDFKLAFRKLLRRKQHA